MFSQYSSASSNIQGIPRPPHSTAPTFETQGLTEDSQRGPITSSSLRESPSRVFGFNTPGSHSFVMDDGAQDGTNKLIRLRTAGGNQIMMNDDSGFVYVINAAGNGWIEISPSGHIDVYGESGINMATKGSINMHADQNINMHAGQHIKIVAQVGAKIQGTEEMQIHGGRLWLEGVDTIEQHSCGQIKLTGYNGMFFKSFDNFVLQGKCFRWNSGTALEAEQVPPEEPESVSGYTTTVERAPNAEPWDGHEGSNSAPSSALGQTTGTPLTIPEGGSINDLLPPASSDSVTSVPGTSADGLSPDQIALRGRAAGEGRTVVPGSYLDRNPIVARATPVERTQPETVVDRVNAQPILQAAETAPPATSRTPLDPSRPESVFNPRPAVGPLAEPATPAESLSFEEYQRQQLLNPNAGRSAAAMAAETLPDPEETASAAEAAAATDRIAGQTAMSSIPALPGGGNTGYFATGDNCARPADSSTGGSAIGPQGGGGAFPGGGSNVVPLAELVNDPEWQAQLAELQEEFPELDEQELYRIIQGESGFDTRIVNPNSGATGLFQFIPGTAAGLGTSTGAIQEMTPCDIASDVTCDCA